MAYVKNATLRGNAWAAHDADIIGNVIIGDESSIWYHTVIRGDLAQIVIGAGTNIQDSSVVHASTGYPCHIGNSVSIGHGAIIHGCSIGNNSERCKDRGGLYHWSRKPGSSGHGNP